MVVIVTSYVVVPAPTTVASTYSIATTLATSVRSSLQFSLVSSIASSASSQTATHTTPSRAEQTGISSHPATSSPSNTNGSEKAHPEFNSGFPKLTLAVLILLGILYTAFIILVLALIYRKRCPSCSVTEAKMKKVSDGERSSITIDEFRKEQENHKAMEARGETVGTSLSLWPDTASLKEMLNRKSKPDIEEGRSIHSFEAHRMTGGSGQRDTLGGDQYFSPSDLPIHMPGESSDASPYGQAQAQGDARHSTPLLPPVNLRNPSPPVQAHVRTSRAEGHDSMGSMLSQASYGGNNGGPSNLYQYPQYAASSIYSTDPPGRMEVIPADDPDTENYRRAAARASDITNPDRKSSQELANRLLIGIRERSRKRRTGGYGGMGGGPWDNVK